MGVLTLVAKGLQVARGEIPITGPMGFGSRIWTGSGTDRNFARDAGPLFDNSVVGTIISLESTMIQEVTVGLQRLKNPAEPTKDESWEWVIPGQVEYDAVEAMVNPNPYYSDDVLWNGTILSDLTNGNGYWLIRRSRQISRTTKRGRPAGYWYIPHFQVRPSAEGVPWNPQDGTKLVTHYEYTPLGGGVTLDIDPADVVHFRNGIDPYRLNLGLSPLACVLRDVVGENEAATFSAVILANMGVPGVIMSSKVPVEDQDEDQRKRLRAAWNSFTRDRRGEPFVAPVPIDVAKIAFSPRDLMADAMRSIPAARICAALGYDPMAAKLPSENKTYANYGEARQAAWEETTLPRFKRRLRQLADATFADFDLDRNRYRYWIDVDQIRALRDDLDAKWKRVKEAFLANMIDRATAKNILGLPSGQEDVGVYASDVPGVADATAEAATKSALVRSLMGRAAKYRLQEGQIAVVEQ